MDINCAKLIYNLNISNKNTIKIIVHFLHQCYLNAYEPEDLFLMLQSHRFITSILSHVFY